MVVERQIHPNILRCARKIVPSDHSHHHISEYSDPGITVRGTYFSFGLGERNFFLAVELTNEMSVLKAKVEIMRLLKEELIRLQTSGMHHSSKSRWMYWVL